MKQSRPYAGWLKVDFSLIQDAETDIEQSLVAGWLEVDFHQFRTKKQTWNTAQPYDGWLEVDFSLIQDAGTDMDENLCSILVGVVQVVGTGAAILIVDRYE